MLSRRSMMIAAAGLGLTGLASSLTATSALAASPKPFDATAFAAAQKAGKPILIHVHATWCPTCKAQTPILDQLTGDAMFRNLAFFIVDFDSQKDVLQKFGVRAQSTLLAFKGDKETGRSAGDTNRASIATLLDKTL
jgi:thioredoxin-like negative regulator of GroEL